ncbi:putative peroxisomal membrane protein pex16 protein [Neofusicoccum parvum UCRNP2]|uniref:Peroxisomal membrane protein PEX16 n=1 Tax=Botryosphaeria parva (strain UCR-NP2) TaxID=1287680 RepID=R1E5A7_BOTPV|nr:putative peroxisomal membrane protein pex16 protein [Neofusicoccum parvum UCRNP2]
MDSCKQASHKVSEALSLPPKWLGQYSEFITKNASAVSQIESALRSLTYIIPGRFRESEIASESSRGVQLLSLYHDSLLAKAVARLPPAQRPRPTAHSRYTRFWTQNSLTYKRIALTLQMIQYTELLWEMAAKRKGEKVRWRVVVLLEAIKAICRLLLLRLTNSRPLLSPPLPQREFDPSTLEENTEGSSFDGAETPKTEKSDDASWTMPRTGLSLPSLPDSHDISSYLLSKVLTADDIKPPKALLHRVTGNGEFAEVLYIIRPVIYALAMQHWQLAKKDFQERLAGGLRGLTGLEKEELRKRGWGMGWWLLRGAFYESVTKAWIQSVTRRLQGKPLLDIVGGVIEDYEYLWDQYYFSTTTL